MMRRERGEFFHFMMPSFLIVCVIVTEGLRIVFCVT